jgi:hypothetical protein
MSMPTHIANQISFGQSMQPAIMPVMTIVGENVSAWPVIKTPRMIECIKFTLISSCINQVTNKSLGRAVCPVGIRIAIFCPNSHFISRRPRRAERKYHQSSENYLNALSWISSSNLKKNRYKHQHPTVNFPAEVTNKCFSIV